MEAGYTTIDLIMLAAALFVICITLYIPKLKGSSNQITDFKQRKSHQHPYPSALM